MIAPTARRVEFQPSGALLILLRGCPNAAAQSLLVLQFVARIERLKGYPYIARANRWEGLVILEAVINHEGVLVDLKIAESSGHSVLDQDAMEVIRKSCPLQLKHSLGKSEMTMRVPISYKLRL